MSSINLEGLKSWFLEERRDFPWRADPSPYKVWISEVMLQQTQSSVVVPYFERWMTLFPTVSSLAQASFSEVLKAWEGLGYYSRARNLHLAAIYMVEQHEGQVPSKREELEKIKGLGPYTIGAILSFAFHKKESAVDGNVARVLSRYFLFEEDVTKAKNLKKLDGLTRTLLPEDEPWVVMEALIELGSQVCQRRPKCELCILKDSCLAYLHGKAALLPIKREKIATTELIRDVAIIMHRDEVLLRCESKGKVMADLYEFPYLERSLKRTSSESSEKSLKLLKKELMSLLNLEVEFHSVLPLVKHSFTRFRATLFPGIWIAAQKNLSQNYQWIKLRDAIDLPFSAGHRQILKSINEVL